MPSVEIINDRVRNNTSDSINRQIDIDTEANIQFFGMRSEQEILTRIEELDKEWDIERVLELNAAAFGLTGVLLSATVSKKFLVLPAIVAYFLGQHAIQGWCPPLSVLRGMKIRTRKEIDKEKYALLKMLGK